MKRQFAILAVALTALLGLPALTATASASSAKPPNTATTVTDCYPGCEPPTTLTGGGSSNSSGKSPTQSKTQQSSTPANQGVLAFTGADVAVTVAVAGLLLAVGLVLMALTRRRTT